MSDKSPAITPAIREAMEAENSLTRFQRDLSNATTIIREAYVWEQGRVDRERALLALDEEMKALRAKTDKEKAALAEETRKAASQCEDAQRRLAEAEARAEKTIASAKAKADALVAEAQSKANELMSKARADHAQFKAQAEAEAKTLKDAAQASRVEAATAQKARDEAVAQFNDVQKQLSQIAGARLR